MGDGRNANLIDRRIGQRVRARRLEIGMSQESLAERLGITFQQVQKYEKGVNRIAASRLYDLGAALDMPIARFFEGLGAAEARAKSRGAAAEGVLSTLEGAQLAALFVTIKNTKTRQRVLKLVRALVEAG